MDFTSAEAAARVGLSSDELSAALASYVRTIRSGNSAFDRFMDGDRAALTVEQRTGLELFSGKAGCVACHIGPTFTDERLHNTGVAWTGEAFTDSGGGRGDFKTPTLRDVGRTGPYMHDGSMTTLDDVVDFYDRGGRINPHIDPLVRHAGCRRRRNVRSSVFWNP